MSVIVVAELSGNHCHDWERVVRLVEAAKTAGADAVKGQCFTPGGMTLDIDDAAHRLTWAGQERTLHDLYTETAMPMEWHARLMVMCADLGMIYFASEFTPADVDYMDALGVPYHKCASFELTDLSLIRHMAGTGKNVILSTGMATWDEIWAALRLVHPWNATLLKCTSAYPAPITDTNMRTLADMRPYARVGLSDHSRNNSVVSAAVALGASMVERHLTLWTRGGPDGAYSDDPDEFAAMVRVIRDTEAAMGAVHYGSTASEQVNLHYRRSLWVTQDIAEDEPFTLANVASLRPIGGLAPSELPRVLGMTAPRAYRRGEPLTWSVPHPTCRRARMRY